MQTFNTPNPISAAVDVILGNIHFAASDRTDTVAEVRPADPAWALDVTAAAEAEIEFANGKLSVKQPKLRNLWTTKYGSVEVLVQLPTGSDIQGDTSNGEYVVEGVVGTCQLKTPAGNIQVEQAADVRLRTTSGTVTVGHVTGQADVSGNGDIRIRQVDGRAVVKNIGGNSWLGEVAGDVRANSANGGITVEVAHAAINAKTASGNIRVGELGSGAVDLYTATGTVELGVPHDAIPVLDARTTAGRVRNNLGAPARSGRNVKVRARSHGGDIVLNPVA